MDTVTLAIPCLHKCTYGAIRLFDETSSAAAQAVLGCQQSPPRPHLLNAYEKAGKVAAA